MPGKSIPELEFALMCLKAMEPNKPNFEAIGEQLGITKQAAYFRHWNMMKKFNAANNGSGGAAASLAPPKTPGKRKAKGKEDSVEDDETITVDIDGHNIDGTPSKKAKASTSKSATKPKGTAKVKKVEPKVEPKIEPKTEEEAEVDHEGLTTASANALADIVTIDDEN